MLSLLHMVSTSSALQFILHIIYWVLQHQNFCLLMFKSFHYFRNCSYVHYFYSSANWSVFGSFLLACWASSWHYFEFSTCLITLLHDIKLVHGKLLFSFCDSMLLWFFMVLSGLLLCPCIWGSKQCSYVCKALYTLILTIQQIANRGPSAFFD